MQCKSREYTFLGGENLNYELKSFRLYANKPLCFFSSVPCLAGDAAVPRNFHIWENMPFLKRIEEEGRDAAAGS